MYRICCLNNISKKGTGLLGPAYQLTDQLAGADAVLVRSADMHELELPDSLQAIARAGAGVNNIPLEKCADAGIVVSNAPGANSNAVKELVIAGMLLASRDIVGGIEWAKAGREDPDVSKAAEKAKKQFAGTEISGKTLGIIGLGAIGHKLAHAAEALGMNVIGYDPYVELADVNMTKDLDELYADSDFVTIHVPLLPDTKGMINAAAIGKMKDGVIILNYARDQLVDEADMAAALESGKVRRYLCDFANPNTLHMKHAIVTPHLGASTAESEENCASMAARDVKNYLECGNLIHPVTFPRVDAGEPKRAVRLGVFFRDQAALDALKTMDGAEVTGDMRGGYGYAVVDLDAMPDLKRIEAFPGVYKVRVVRA